MQEMYVQSLGWEDPLEEKMTTHCSILAWRIPWIDMRCEQGSACKALAESKPHIPLKTEYWCYCYLRRVWNTHPPQTRSHSILQPHRWGGAGERWGSRGTRFRDACGTEYFIIQVGDTRWNSLFWYGFVHMAAKRSIFLWVFRVNIAQWLRAWTLKLCLLLVM